MPGSTPPSPNLNSSPAADKMTVLLSVLGSALVSALIITVGVVAMLRAGGDSQTVILGADGQATTTKSTTSARATSSTSRTSTAPTSAASASRNATTAGSASAAGSPAGTATPGTSGDTADASSGVPTPTPEELSEIVYFLTATDAPDEEKKRYLEAEDAIIVPQTVSRTGIFRAPRGGSEVTGPVTREGDTVTAQLHSWSQGIPDVNIPIQFIYRDGTWRLASSSICLGVQTVGLPIYCNA